jgi:hypothetical protein
MSCSWFIFLKIHIQQPIFDRGIVVDWESAWNIAIVWWDHDGFGVTNGGGPFILLLFISKIVYSKRNVSIKYS